MTRLTFKLCSLIALKLSLAPQLHAQAGAAIPPPIYLWPSGAPGALGSAEADKPRMYAFLPKARSTSAAVLVIPGGGYEHVAIGHEGFQIATWLNAQGMPAFVLDYRVKPYRYPVEIDDGRRAMRISVSNWQTSREDVAKTIAGVRRVLTRMRECKRTPMHT